MNEDRRKKLAEAVAKIEEVKNIVDLVKSDEQDAFDNMPEGFQAGEKGQAAEEKINSLDNAGDELDNAINSIDEATS